MPRKKENTPAVTTNAAIQQTEPDTDPEIAGWMATLGPDGVQKATEAGELITEMGQLLEAAEQASKEQSVPMLEDLERRARVLNKRASASALDWVRDLVAGGFRSVAFLLALARGDRFVMEWRHERAKKEYHQGRDHCIEAVRLFTNALAGMPPLRALDPFRQMFVPYVQVIAQLGDTIGDLERYADVDALLLKGQVKEYIVGVRALAASLRTQGEGMLETGASTAELLTASAQLTGKAELLESRAEAVEQAYRGRELYLPPEGDKVFIIHGHAEDKWRELRDLLEEQLGLAGRVIVLKEEAGQSKTVLEKFEEYANQSCYAFALVTPDDLVSQGEQKYGQARPNVLFEIGWFFGRYGSSRLCILKKGKDTPLPSDMGGVLTLEFTDSVEEKFLRLQQELKAAGVIG